MIIKDMIKSVYGKYLAQAVHLLFLRDLVSKTNDFDSVTWLGYPVWQSVTDLWVIQETIASVHPDLLIECGTNRGGSSMFYAHLFDLMGGGGKIVTIDIEKLHELSHPRITYLIGSSTSEEILSVVRERVAGCSGPIMVILDSDHSRDHVRRELDLYTPFVTVGSYCLVQDGVIDVLSSLRHVRPGPLPAIEDFLKSTNEFEVDEERCSRFIVTHHPKGWLRRSKQHALN
jgi:cephalosporin hydroxylase